MVLTDRKQIKIRAMDLDPEPMFEPFDAIGWVNAGSMAKLDQDINITKSMKPDPKTGKYSFNVDLSPLAKQYVYRGTDPEGNWILVYCGFRPGKRNVKAVK